MTPLVFWSCDSCGNGGEVFLEAGKLNAAGSARTVEAARVRTGCRCDKQHVHVSTGPVYPLAQAMEVYAQ